jgi:hypothetical protein
VTGRRIKKPKAPRATRANVVKLLTRIERSAHWVKEANWLGKARVQAMRLDPSGVWRTRGTSRDLSSFFPLSSWVRSWLRSWLRSWDSSWCSRACGDASADYTRALTFAGRMETQSAPGPAAPRPLYPLQTCTCACAELTITNLPSLSLSLAHSLTHSL